MRIVADLHIHSHFSRATSRNLTFEHLTRWAQLKGVHVVGTGDIAHPGWLAEMREKLEPAEEGLYRLKDELARAVQATVPSACHWPVRFVLGGEISNIYKKAGRTRKVHNVVFAPSFAAVGRLQGRLEKIGNIRSDGRPILGLDSRDLFETLLEVDSACHLIPAHIWTPWFSLLGSKSGFDSVEECFGDLTPHIFALETGLSSDPPMNRRVSQLDRYTLVSNSDAHSPEKLAREATLFDTELSYAALFGALRTGDAPAFAGTIEFFPEEGKYHLDGHRSCGVVWDPPTTIRQGGICTGCGKPVTVGVMHRVEELADRPEGGHTADVPSFHSLIPLPEVLGEVFGVGAGSKQVEQEYAKLLARLGPELFILRDAAIEDLQKSGGERLAEAVARMRQGEVTAQPGYDGEYGVIRLFAAPGAAARAAGQYGLFGEEAPVLPAAALHSDSEVAIEHKELGSVEDAAQPSFFDLETADIEIPAPAHRAFTVPAAALLGGLNDAQREAVRCLDASLVIVAGPGTGKTRTLTHRIAYLILQRSADPASVLAITFTNKAAGEMAERLHGLLGAEANAISVSTFHALGAALLRSYGYLEGIDPTFVLCNEDDRVGVLSMAYPEMPAGEMQTFLESISRFKNGLPIGQGLDERFGEVLGHYEQMLALGHALDFDDLLVRTVRLLENHPQVLGELQRRFRWISVDEYQDVNAVQARLLRLLAAGGANLCVIGDPDQAIYGFRGADSSHFLEFMDGHSDARKLTLRENYRSTQMILDAARQVVAARDGSAPGERELHALADFAEQVKLEVYTAPTDRAEAEYVVHQIEQMVGGTSYFSLDSGRASGATPKTARSFADFAVLYRLGKQSDLLIEAFQRSGIPFQSAGPRPLHAYADVRQVLDYLWLVHNPRSRLHLARVVGGKRGLGAEALDAILAGLEREDLAGVLHRAAVNSTKSDRARTMRLAALYAELLPPQPVFLRLERLRSFALASADGGAAQRFEQLQSKAAVLGDDLGGFLQSVTLEGETDLYDPRADRVALMTLHAAKGLEFPVVFIVGCEEGLLPYARGDKESDFDEERRLFYVGMTRAQQKLVLVHARKRFLYGQQVAQPQSRFVNDIETALKDVREVEARRPDKKREAPQLSLF
jgi:DNA helicase II / ATP-dependent DNA helicase PcrA